MTISLSKLAGLIQAYPQLLFQFQIYFMFVSFGFQEQKISPGDLPDLREMQEKLVTFDFTKFKSFNKKLLDDVDVILGSEISKLMGMIPQVSKRLFYYVYYVKCLRISYYVKYETRDT